MPGALARAAKCLKGPKTAMGGYWEKLAWMRGWRHVRLGLAPRLFGVGVAPVWDRLDHADSQSDKSVWNWLGTTTSVRRDDRQRRAGDIPLI